MTEHTDAPVFMMFLQFPSKDQRFRTPTSWLPLGPLDCWAADRASCQSLLLKRTSTASMEPFGSDMIRLARSIYFSCHTRASEPNFTQLQPDQMWRPICGCSEPWPPWPRFPGDAGAAWPMSLGMALRSFQAPRDRRDEDQGLLVTWWRLDHGIGWWFWWEFGGILMVIKSGFLYGNLMYLMRLALESSYTDPLQWLQRWRRFFLPNFIPMGWE